MPLPRDNQVPQPQKGHSPAWNQDNVRLPNSRESTFSEIDEFGNRSVKPRWDLIEQTLLQPILTSRDLEKAIKKYNSRYEDVWEFKALHFLFDNCLPQNEVDAFFGKLLPSIINIALQLPQLIQRPIPLLKKNMNHSISLSQQQVASLLANAFLCTFPMRNTDKRKADFATYPKINFSSLYCAIGYNIIEKLRCILNYFNRVLSKETPANTITFQRRSIANRFMWERSDLRFSHTKLYVTSNGKIEEAEGMLQVDFANRFVGGGVLGHGCVQEEIRFVMNPEMIVTRLFTESLEDEEALIMIGCEQFNSYKGYGANFKWAGNFVDKTPLDRFRRRKCRVVAIDALSYENYDEQFKQTTIRRELNKAFAGFYKYCDNDSSPIASGLWGCGAFNGHRLRSIIIQLMACLAAQRNVAFYTFGDVETRNQVDDIFEFLVRENVTIREVYAILKTFEPADPSQLIPFIRNEIKIARTKAPENKIKQQPSLFNFINIRPMEMKRDRPSLQEKIDEPSSSSNAQVDSGRSNSEVIRDKQKFEEIANVFSPYDTSTKPMAKKKEAKSTRKSLLECLDETL